MLLHCLIATESHAYARKLAQWLAEEGIRISTLSKDENLWSMLRSRPCDLLIVDEELFGANFHAGIQSVRDLPSAPEVVIFSDTDSPAHRAELLAAEAFAILNPRTDKADLIKALHTLVERRTEQARQDVQAEQLEERGGLRDFATLSPQMKEFLDLVDRVVDSESTLLVQGQTGVGKEFLSRAIHFESPRREAPFIAVNCSALSENLLESELFGHVEGAFTGAQRARRGYFEMAHEGTLFIDEVGELTPKLQVKLLRVIQDRIIQPVGSEEEFEVDVRIIAATNRDLIDEVNQGRFRADLFYRLSVVTLEVPALQDRREDIPALIQRHLDEFRSAIKRPIQSVSAEAMELLCAYSWPGNVRELSNVVERAVLLCRGDSLDVSDLPEEIRKGLRLIRDPDQERPAPSGAQNPVPQASESLPDRPFAEARQETLDTFELQYLQGLLQRSNGRIKDAARMAGLNTRSLYEKMKKHGLRKEYFKV